MVGRGFRIHEGKADCLILDYGHNIEKHGPVDAIRIKGKKKGDGVAPVKECPECHHLIHASYMVCPECQFAFPPKELKHGSKASSEGVITGESKEHIYEVKEIRYASHTKRGTAPGDAPPTLRVDYSIGWNKWQSEWVCIEHQGFARKKALGWWGARTTIPMPETVDKALDIARAGGLASPTSITVRETTGDYNRIVKHEPLIQFEPGDSFEIPDAELVEVLQQTETFGEIPF